jgi:hypothetical protein
MDFTDGDIDDIRLQDDNPGTRLALGFTLQPLPVPSRQALDDRSALPGIGRG